MQSLVDIADIDDDDFLNTFYCVEDLLHLVQLVQQNPSFTHMVGPTGETLLHFACQYGSIDVVKILIGYGLDINAQNHLQQTPLQISIESGNFDCAHLLIDYGCDYNATDFRGDTPLMCALCSRKSTANSLIQRLIAKGVSDTANFLGLSPLHLIVLSFTKDDLKRTRFKIGIDAGWCSFMERPDNGGHTPLLSAVYSRNSTMVDLLMEAGANANPMNNEGWNVLHLAGSIPDIGVIEALRRAEIQGIDIRTRDHSNCAPLGIFWYQRIMKLLPLARWRRPGVEEIIAFEKLLRGVRDRTIRIEQEKIHNIIAMITKCNTSEAREELCRLAQAKDDAKIEWEGETFRAINLQIQLFMLEPAIESLEEFMEVSQARLRVSPFNEPDVDPLYFRHHRWVEDEDEETRWFTAPDSEIDDTSSEDDDQSLVEDDW